MTTTSIPLGEATKAQSLQMGVPGAPVPDEWKAAAAPGPENESDGPLLTAALDCVRRGWFVLPCYPQKKWPAGEVVPNGVLDASNDESVVRGWWARNPNYNPAIALGPSNLVVFDFDNIAPFDYLPATFTVQPGRLPVNGFAGVQMYFSGSCKTHGHVGGGGEVRSRGAYVMAAGAIHQNGNPYLLISDVPLAVSPEQNESSSTAVGPAIGTEEQETIAGYVEDAFAAAGVDYQARVANDSGGFKWFIACPWKDEHTTGNDFDSSSAVIMWPSGMRIYECKHSHCQSIRQWKELRAWMEDKVGRLPFAEPEGSTIFSSRTGNWLNGPEADQPVAAASDKGPNASEASVESVTKPEIDAADEDAIPPFDPSVINGIYAKIVELITRGTTMTPQFSFAVAKTVIGLKMAGKVAFDILDVEPRLNLAMLGETGSGKGMAYRRMLKILQPDGGLGNLVDMKIIESVDSGAGLKDLFFKKPVHQPVLCYVDEVHTLGNKSADGRNPGILDVMGELADSTNISRTLAENSGGDKSTNDARLATIMCGQNGTVYAKAFAGRADLGYWDRLYPEHAVAVEAGDEPPVNRAEAFALLEEIIALDYSGTMTVAPAAKMVLDEFWKSQPAEVRKKVRWKKNLTLDVFLSAFGRGTKVAELEDVEIGLKIFTRQLVIRRVCFTTEIPDRIGYYNAGIKKEVMRMTRRLRAGVPREMVAMSRRDFEKATNASRDNEEHVFIRAWSVISSVYLVPVPIKKGNGRTYEKFLPIPTDSTWGQD